jgi:hypothetical protein
VFTGAGGERRLARVEYVQPNGPGINKQGKVGA